MCRVVCCACVLKWLCVCVESVCGVCAGVGAQCVVCGVCGVCCVCAVWCVCVVCVWRGLTRGKLPVCRLKTSPCAGSKRLRVYPQNDRMCSTCARFAGTHGGVLNLHTETFFNLHTGRRKGSLLSLSLSTPLSLSSSFSRPFSLSLFLLLSLFRRSLPSFSFSFSSHFSSSLLFSLNTNDNDHSSSRLSLCVHTALTCESVRVRVLRSIPCLANMFTSCKKQLSWFYCASPVPLGVKWAYTQNDK